MNKAWGQAILDLHHQKQSCVKEQTAPVMMEKPFLRNANWSGIACSCFDHSLVAAAWILVTQVSVETFAPDAVWHEATFRTQVWLLERDEKSPRLILEEFSKRVHPDSPIAITDLVNDIDRVVIERETIYVRDKRVLAPNELSICKAWRAFPRVQSVVLAECA